LTNGGHIREEDLPLLAVGAMPEEECAALRAHAEGCAECAAKLAEERGRAALLAMTAEPEKPAATIKAELFARLRAEREKEEHQRWEVKETARDRGAVSAARGVWWNWVLAPVAAALLIAAAVEWREGRRLEAELGGANQRLAEMVKERQRTEMMLDVLAAQDTVSVKMAGMPEPEKASGLVQYNARKGMVMYTAVLPPLPADKIYQMWLVPATGAPMSAGIFAPRERGARQMWMAEVPVNTQAKLFAVTIEPAGGVPQPTGPKVLVGTTGG
jgi:anti-sigma-K factor RskA